jgi:predicted membrane-bound mannosyltransferase
MKATLDTTRQRPWEGLEARAEAAAAVLEKKWLLITLVFVEAYLAITILHGLRRFWYDELFTYYMTQLPSMSAVWSALKDGADLNPPLFYVVTRAFQKLFGNSELATRLPAILGFLLMLLCIFQFVSRYGSRLAGLAAMSFPLITGAYYYSSEARAYGMVLGFAGVAAVCWQSAARNERRNIALPGLAAALGCALLSHCYAVLAMLPFALAELVRIVIRRKLDWPMLAALAAPCPLVLVYLPLIGATRGDSFDNPFFRAEWTSIPVGYVKLFGDALVPLLLAGVFLAFARWRGGSLPKPPAVPEQKAAAPIPAHEMALALGFALAPVFAVLLAMTVTRIYEFRYGLPSTIGVSILLGALVARWGRQSNAAAAAVLVLFTGAFAVASGAWLASPSAAPKPSRQAPEPPLRLADLSAGVPIVIADPILFLEFDHYESAALIGRMYYLTDRAAALRYTGVTVFGTLDRVKKWFPIRSRLEDYREFVSSHPRFFVLTSDRNPLCWVMRKVADDGLPVVESREFSSHHGHAILSEIIVPPEK